ncbi:DUF723 domain-containing protein [Vibrio parahaemolyticus]|uniref:DUF723 domain-containing protein n=1 Tax=Vibrio parahaemolyticus TaxID=670 RepID=UPI002B2546A6|nr:DUF723 domain-containing protein [Vibrio parahaemolyticus]MEB2468446.1 DUF723 domain-containing protein [Vibrio parahaemolyticus]
MGRKRISAPTYVERLNDRYGRTWCFEVLDLKGSRSVVSFKCPLHGYRKKSFENLMRGDLKTPCPTCIKKALPRKPKPTLTTEEYVIKLKARYGNTLLYHLVDYKGCQSPVVLVCPKHGEFVKKRAGDLLRKGCTGCPACVSLLKIEKSLKPFSSFVQEAEQVHSGKYTYIESSYRGASRKISVVCPLHGSFQLYARDHLRGRGCPVCSGGGRRRDRTDLLASVYCVELEGNGSKFYKIGFTTMKGLSRFSNARMDGLTFRVIDQIKLPYPLARKHEKYLIESNTQHIVDKTNVLKYLKGGSECFTQPINIRDGLDAYS